MGKFRFVILGVIVFGGAQWILAGIRGSKHDFTDRSFVPSGQVCFLCHSPHNSATNAPQGAFVDRGAALLWNHRPTQAIFRPYASSTLKATVGQPGGSSRYCLDCHDGTMPIDAILNWPGSEFCNKIIGTDLRTVHPVSFVYDDALAAQTDHLKFPSVTPSGFGGSIANDLLKRGKMECTSCHDPHNFYNEGKFLRKHNGKDGLCGTCHTKEPPGRIDMGGW